MGSYSKTYRATAAPSVGANWEDVANIYDTDVSSYAQRKSYSTSATHINGFGINLPSYAVLESVEVHSKLYANNSYGYIYVYMYTDDGPTGIKSTSVVNGASLSAQYVTHTYTAEEIQSALDSKGVCNGDLLEFLKTLRVRFVIGCTKTSALYSSTCRVYDNYVVVNYTIPDITYTYVDYDGTVLKTQTVEQGTSPTAPSNPTRTSTAEYTYTFSGWSLSGTTYTAQYTATKRSYTVTISASPEGAGTVTGGDSYEYGSSVTLTAAANSGYRFSKWSDGVTTASRSVTVTGAATYTAIFEPVYVTFDSILNFEKWKTNGITGSNATVSDITETGFTLTSNSGVSEGTATSPTFPVEEGKSYKIDIDFEGDGWDVYIFFYDADTSSGTGLDFLDSTNRFSSNGGGVSSRSFTVPEGAVKACIRVDANGSSNTVSYGNFRIYPADYDYMGSSVSAENRSNAVSWDIPTPTRAGYEFLGWNTEPDGSGTAFTSASAFPAEDLTLYSTWKSSSKIYIGTQKVSAVYLGTQKLSVYCGTQKLI